MKKLMLVLILLVASGVCYAYVPNWWISDSTNVDHDNLWSNPLNWSVGVVPGAPGATDHLLGFGNNANCQYPVNIDIDARAAYFNICGGPNNPGNTEIIINLLGKNLTGYNCLTKFVLGESNPIPATFNILNGGYLSLSSVKVGGGSESYPANGVGIFNIIDGVAITKELIVGSEWSGNTGAYGRVIVERLGLLTVNVSLDIRDSVNNSPASFIDLRGGRMTMPDGNVTHLQNLVTAGKILGFGGSRGVLVYEASGLTIAEADVLGPFYFVPTPADGGFAPSVDPLTLSWLLPDPPSSVTGTILVDVYWNTDKDGNGGNQVLTDGPDAKTVDVTGALYNTTYNWKIVATVPYTSGTVIEEAVFSLSTNREPTIAADAIDYQWLEDDTRTVGITATVTDADGIGDHTYTYSVADDSPTTGATFGSIVESNETATGVDLSADVTFTTAGDYILQVEVNDNDEHTITNTVTVTVYADGCVAVINEGGYDVNAARARGDFNHNCQADLDDLAQLASKWLESKALKY